MTMINNGTVIGNIADTIATSNDTILNACEFAQAAIKAANGNLEMADDILRAWRGADDATASALDYARRIVSYQARAAFRR
jgi:hypothetical protein